ncbi:MAG: copper chaperone CopZ [Clostridiales bacterium]|nr:copper chaperone CopZ [Clostridiales bacterium]
MKTTTLKVLGMSCEHCVRAVTGALTALDGVQEAKVSLQNGTAEVRFDPEQVTEEQLRQAVWDQGYDAP